MHNNSELCRGGGDAVPAPAVLESLGRRVLLAGIALDRSFGSDRWATAAFSGDYLDSGQALAVQPDRKVIVAGLTQGANSSAWRILVARLNADGSLDNTFGKRGIFQTGRRWYSAAGYDVAVQEDGRIVVAGKMEESMGAIRVMPNGTWDRSFGDKGATVLDELRDSYATSMYLEEDGDIVLAGQSEVRGDQHLALTRLQADGSRDPSFGEAGIRTLRVEAKGWQRIVDVAAQGDGKIVALGDVSNQSPVNLVMMRFDEEGQLDESFGDHGIVMSTSLSSWGKAAALQVMSDDSILAVGEAGGDLFIVKFRHDGRPARAFADSGQLVMDLGGDYDSAGAVVVENDGRIVVFARAWEMGGESHKILLRFDRRGAADAAFGTQGRLVLETTRDPDLKDMATASDGSIFILGSAWKGSGDMQVLHVAPEGRIDESFGNAGRATIGWRGPLHAQTRQLLKVPNGGVYALALVSEPNGGHPAIVRFDERGRLDESFGGDGKLIFRRLEDSGGRIELDGEGRLLFVTVVGNTGDTVVRRFNSDGSRDATFGAEGKVVLPDAGIYAGDIEVQDDGRILIGGAAARSMYSEYALMRLLPDGSLDSDFGTSGVVITEMRHRSSSVSDVLIRPDGRIVTVGTSHDIYWPTDMDNMGGMVAARYEPDGSLDESFHGDGRIFIGVGKRQEAQGIAGHLLEDGSMLIVGSYAFRDELILARLTPDGSPDTAFGKKGRRTFRPGGYPVGGWFSDDGSLLLQRENDGDANERVFWRIGSDGRRDKAFGEMVISGLPRGGEFRLDAAGRLLFGSSIDGKLAIARYVWQ